jgi:hypothetical protein
MKKYGIRFAAAGALAFTALAGGIFFCAQSSAPFKTAAAQTANAWEELPQVTGWTWGAFDAETVPFTGVPVYGKDRVNYTFTGKALASPLRVSASVTGGQGGYTFAYYDADGIPIGNFTDYLAAEMGAWDAGEYSMTVSVEGDAEYAALSGTVRFPVRKAENYWKEVPRITTWYEKEFADLAEYPLPSGEAACGETVLAIYAARAQGDGFVADQTQVYYKKDAATRVNRLDETREGFYVFSATVAGTKNYGALSYEQVFRVEPQDSALAELNRARTEAVEELKAYAEDLGVDVDLSIFCGSIESAPSLAEVAKSLSASKVQIDRHYALNALREYAESHGVDNYTQAIADELREIDDATVRDEVYGALGRALEKLENLALATARYEAIGEMQAYAASLGFDKDQPVPAGWINSAQSFEEVAYMLAAAKDFLARRAYTSGSGTVSARKKAAEEALVKHGAYVFGGENEKYAEFIEQVRFAGTADQVHKIYLEAKDYVDGLLEEEREKAASRLHTYAYGFTEKYPAAKDKIQSIVAPDGENGTALQELQEKYNAERKRFETVVGIQMIVSQAEREIYALALAAAKAGALEELETAVEEIDFYFDPAPAQAAISAAKSIEEVNAALADALGEIANGLWAERMNAFTELEGYASQYLTDQNWRALQTALAAGKEKIAQAGTLSGIGRALVAAKNDFARAWAEEELNGMLAQYEAYGIQSAVAEAKAQLAAAEGMQACEEVLASARVSLCAAAKQAAKDLLAAEGERYPSYDTSAAERAIDAADTIENLHLAFTSAKEEIDGLVSALEEEKQTAKAMLEAYARSLGVGKLAAVKDAVATIDGAGVPDEIPALFDAALSAIDQAAEAERARVHSVNVGLIAGLCVFGAAAIGMGAALVVILLRMKKNAEEHKTEEND